MDMADLEEDLAMLAGASPHNSGSWDSGTLARAGRGKTLWIGEYFLQCLTFLPYYGRFCVAVAFIRWKGGTIKNTYC